MSCTCSLKLVISASTEALSCDLLCYLWSCIRLHRPSQASATSVQFTVCESSSTDHSDLSTLNGCWRYMTHHTSVLFVVDLLSCRICFLVWFDRRTTHVFISGDEVRRPLHGSSSPPRPIACQQVISPRFCCSALAAPSFPLSPSPCPTLTPVNTAASQFSLTRTFPGHFFLDRCHWSSSHDRAPAWALVIRMVPMIIRSAK